jgi:F-type H+-transporting ATPase subunit b
MELFKLLSGSEITAQIISFLILLILLRAFVWKRFLGILDARKERIALELKQIEATRSDIEKLRLDYSDKLKNIEDAVRIKTHEAILEGRKVADSIRNKAEEESEKILVNAKENIRIEIAKAKEELKDQIVEVSIDVAGKILEEKLSGDDERRLAEEFVKDIEIKR